MPQRTLPSSIWNVVFSRPEGEPQVVEMQLQDEREKVNPPAHRSESEGPGLQGQNVKREPKSFGPDAPVLAGGALLVRRSESDGSESDSSLDSFYGDRHEHHDRHLEVHEINAENDSDSSEELSPLPSPPKRLFVRVLNSPEDSALLNSAYENVGKDTGFSLIVADLDESEVKSKKEEEEEEEGDYGNAMLVLKVFTGAVLLIAGGYYLGPTVVATGVTLAGKARRVWQRLPTAE